MGPQRRPRPATRDLPPELLEALRIDLGSEVDDLQRALLLAPPVSIRLNPAKRIAERPDRPVPWCTQGRYLAERPVFTLDPLFHAGCYYVQEASSMFLEQAVRASGLLDRPLLALDLCAAPGGKSTHLLSLLHPGSLLVSNEVVRSRQAMLMENIWKWGSGDCVITGSAPERFTALGGIFDLIVIDAPCSGEGMFRKDPFAREQWTSALVRQCSLRQREIIGSAWPALKPGGALIYCTCTWEREENEDQVAWFMEKEGAELIEIPVENEWRVLRTGLGLRFYPHRLSGEGFFISMLRKPGAVQVPLERDNTAEHGREMNELEVDDTVHLVPARWKSILATLQQHLHVLAPGLPFKERGSGVEKLHPALALSSRLPHLRAVDELEVDAAQALSFLRGEALRASNARGGRLVTHQGQALGWANGAGDRWNSRWPRPWRIRLR